MALTFRIIVRLIIYKKIRKEKKIAKQLLNANGTKKNIA